MNTLDIVFWVLVTAGVVIVSLIIWLFVKTRDDVRISREQERERLRLERRKQGAGRESDSSGEGTDG